MCLGRPDKVDDCFVLDGVDLAKDPTDSGSLTRSTTQKSNWYKALLPT